MSFCLWNHRKYYPKSKIVDFASYMNLCGRFLVDWFRELYFRKNEETTEDCRRISLVPEKAIEKKSSPALNVIKDKCAAEEKVSQPQYK